MQTLIHYIKITDTKALITNQNTNISDLSQDFIDTGILVDNIPIAEHQIDKKESLYINPVTLEMWYEYEDMPLSPEKRLIDLETHAADTDYALMMGGLL